MDLLLKLRQSLLQKIVIVGSPKKRGDLYRFLGSTKEERVDKLIKIFLRENVTNEKKKIFEYIVDFWERSTIEIPHKTSGFKGINLAKRPFVTPTGDNDALSFAFGEQYRWDTFFQNRGLILAGGLELAKGQLLNLTDVFEEFRRIPNALVSPFLSRPQPPFEMRMVMDLLEAGLSCDNEVQHAVQMIEEELVSEWFDYQTGKQNHRQSEELVKKYGLLTRYEPHSNPFMVGCEDGKDHNWVVATYSYHHLPVQLNAILYGTVTSLETYYKSPDWGNNTEKASLYGLLRQRMYDDFQKTFWCESGKWMGFRDYSLIQNKEGHILYGDLSAEVFPLFFKLATEEQALRIKDNIASFYAGDIGLATSSLKLREGGSVPVEPQGQWKFQWEYPNCWPPLMMIAVEGLKNYGFVKEAKEYERKWVVHIEKDFERTGGIAEKHVFDSSVKIEEGFYGVMQGFGWTVATYLWFMKDLSGV